MVKLFSYSLKHLEEDTGYLCLEDLVNFMKLSGPDAFLKDILELDSLSSKAAV